MKAFSESNSLSFESNAHVEKRLNPKDVPIFGDPLLCFLSSISITLVFDVSPEPACSWGTTQVPKGCEEGIKKGGNNLISRKEENSETESRQERHHCSIRRRSEDRWKGRCASYSGLKGVVFECRAESVLGFS